MPGSPDNQHPDALAAQPEEEVAARGAVYIRRLKPQVVITFDPIGGYRHPDHIAIHTATVKAFECANDPAYHDPQGLQPFQPQKLYFHIIPHGWLRMGVRLMPLFGKNPREFGLNKDIDLVSIAEVEYPVHARINYSPVMKQRADAVICHESQGGSSLSRGPFGWLRRLFGAREVFMRSYPPADNSVRESDLFAGVRG
jgi:LmbE family N-acetylglucosaminyl deacetylase